MKNFCASLSRIHLYLLITACLTQLIFAQTNDDFVYYKNIVYHANSTLCTHTVPNASFTAYLNRDQSKVLFETAPRWKIGGDPNIAGNGAFGIELGNFANPLVAAGDSVFVRFTCLATGQQGVLSDS
ncbi:MAG: hypothetical protein GWN00_20870, partial [Aliifodinibius sp.]|nr:hypothetical protein [Fodinibius sp.]NIW97120.1 hypothetical protein [Phycisphaerae bacterium]NIY27172.1 hypothetical protein [Fodinibius sp.]